MTQDAENKYNTIQSQYNLWSLNVYKQRVKMSVTLNQHFN